MVSFTFFARFRIRSNAMLYAVLIHVHINCFFFFFMNFFCSRQNRENYLPLPSRTICYCYLFFFCPLQVTVPSLSKLWVRRSYRNAATTGKSERWRVWAATCTTSWPRWTEFTTFFKWMTIRYWDRFNSIMFSISFTVSTYCGFWNTRNVCVRSEGCEGVFERSRTVTNPLNLSDPDHVDSFNLSVVLSQGV